MKQKVAYSCLIIASQLILSACSQPKTVFYGLHTMRLSEGKEVYAKRMVWGLTSDHSITVLSPDKGLYDFSKAKTDYVFGWYEPKIYYKVENETLKLYVNGAARPPESGRFPIRVEQVELNIMDYHSMQDDPGKLGIKCLEVTIDNSP